MPDVNVHDVSKVNKSRKIKLPETAKAQYYKIEPSHPAGSFKLTPVILVAAERSSVSSFETIAADLEQNKEAWGIVAVKEL